MSARAILLPLALWASLAALAAAAPQQRGSNPLSARLESNILKLGASTRLVLTATDVGSPELGALPRVDGLALGPSGRPSMSQQWTNVMTAGGLDRSVTTTFIWRIPVRPTRAGDFEIPPLEVTTDAGTFVTEALGVRVVEDLRGDELGFFEVRPSSARVVEGQPFSLELRFGWDSAISGQMFAELALPWWERLPGVLFEQQPSPLGARTHEVPVNDTARIVIEELPPETIDGRTYRVLRARRTLVPTRTGAIELSGNFLEFGKAIERGGFFSRGAEKGESYFVAAPPVTIDVVPLPEENRPFDYGGAVGTFEARADVDTRDVVEGESIKLTVEWTGEGNLEYFAPPDLARMDAFRGFGVYGMTEDKSFDRRRVVYDIAPRSTSVDEVPPVPLSVFDTENMEYETVTTEPIPLRVRALPGATTLESEARETFADDVHDIDARPLTASGAAPRRALSLAPLAGSLVGLPLAWLGLRALVRRRRGDPGAPVERRRRRARAELARALPRASSPAEELDALVRYLGARTRMPDQAWVGRDPAAWYERTTGAPAPEPVRALAAHVAALERAVYGGAGERPGASEILRAADAARGDVL